MFRRTVLAATAGLIAATAAFASGPSGETANSGAMVVTFLEGAPKDRFVLTNTGSCDLQAVDVTLDLSTSASGVIFDVTGSGAGVEVFQPFEIVSGAGYVGTAPRVADGDKTLMLRLDTLPSGEEVAFTIDVDDTRGTREITVTDSELRGATASVQTAAWTASQAFGETADLAVALPACS
ncbi:aggregation factor core [Tropicimonas sp. TH_r6]|uniref:aggregation factor core n=1 Tax=Tropicimonas sp. TH_r6 TaxID=3082085 RepID=UPI0029556060|nr:aggregation factor core [Tropicimonas sp. TH_r6]MDV7145774.1 aggregation factor core [Tropicimonas sp. TH_r6]